MSVLSDVSIRELGASLIDPFDPARVQPASYDLALGNELLLPLPNSLPGQYETRRVVLTSPFELGPGQCALATTVERITVPSDLVAHVEGKSSLGRIFLSIHTTAGWIDAGFVGEITLELVNHGPWTIPLIPGMRIAQVNFMRLTQPCKRPYGSPGLGSHYQGQRGPTAGRQ